MGHPGAVGGVAGLHAALIDELAAMLVCAVHASVLRHPHSWAHPHAAVIHVLVVGGHAVWGVHRFHVRVGVLLHGHLRRDAADGTLHAPAGLTDIVVGGKHVLGCAHVAVVHVRVRHPGVLWGHLLRLGGRGGGSGHGVAVGARVVLREGRRGWGDGGHRRWDGGDAGGHPAGGPRGYVLDRGVEVAVVVDAFVGLVDLILEGLGELLGDEADERVGGAHLVHPGDVLPDQVHATFLQLDGGHHRDSPEHPDRDVLELWVLAQLAHRVGALYRHLAESQVAVALRTDDLQKDAEPELRVAGALVRRQHLLQPLQHLKHHRVVCVVLWSELRQLQLQLHRDDRESQREVPRHVVQR